MTLNEADTRAELIDPELRSRGWRGGRGVIRREQTSVGAVQIVNGKPRRSSSKTADYTLSILLPDSDQPVKVAVIEAKAERYSPTRGLQQAKQTADVNRHNVPFAFSSNGHLFVEYDASTGLTTAPKPLSEFPTPEELRRRYEESRKLKLDGPDAKPLLTPYSGGQHSIRYYQDAAVRSVLEKIAKGEKRALLSLATGTGKTLIAVNILKRVAETGQLRKALFICDRDVLRNQGLTALRQTFGSDAARATARNPEKNARVIVATYQTLGIAAEEDDASYLRTHYPENYFSHIVIDECHRSAWNKWSEVLTRNPDAVQIGLTATPRQFDYEEESPDVLQDQEITRDNLIYFGFPAYEYSIGQGMDDGYLALMQVERREAFIARNVDPERETGVTKSDLQQGTLLDAHTGQTASLGDVREQYGAPSIEDRLRMPDRVRAMCKDLFDLLASNGEPKQKTIIFCVNTDHAAAVANEMNNLYANWCRTNSRTRVDNYAFQCTSKCGREHIEDFKGANAHHFIATTVDLLTTGVDVPVVENIVFFRYVQSPISFHQMIGRGTRIDEARGKLAFTVYDYTNATRLLGTELKAKAGGDGTSKPGPPKPPETTVEVHGIPVNISPAGKFIVTTDDDGRTRLVPLAEYKQRVGDALKIVRPNIRLFTETWISPQTRRDMLKGLPDGAGSADLIRELSMMREYDLFDVLAHITFGIQPRTRAQRLEVFEERNLAWLDSLPANTRDAIIATTSQFSKGGIENLELSSMFDTPEVLNAGGAAALDAYPDKDGAFAALRETKRRIFAD